MTSNPHLFKPSKTGIPFAEARLWRAGGDYLFQIKKDGVFHVEQYRGHVLACERMRDGTLWAHTLLGSGGESFQDVNLRETMPMLRRIVPELARFNPSFRLMPEFSGGEGLEAVFADGEEGGVAKHLDAKPWLMYACKRVQVFICRVIDLDYATGGVWLADATTGERRGKMPLRGNKFESVRVGSVLKVEAFGLTAKGLLREARPDKDTPTSWLVSF